MVGIAKRGFRDEKQKSVDVQKAERETLIPKRDEVEKRKTAAEQVEKEAKDRQDNEWNGKTTGNDFTPAFSAAREARRREKAARIFQQLDANADQKYETGLDVHD